MLPFYAVRCQSSWLNKGTFISCVELKLNSVFDGTRVLSAQKYIPFQCFHPGKWYKLCLKVWDVDQEQMIGWNDAKTLHMPCRDIHTPVENWDPEQEKQVFDQTAVDCRNLWIV